MRARGACSASSSPRPVRSFDDAKQSDTERCALPSPRCSRAASTSRPRRSRRGSSRSPTAPREIDRTLEVARPPSGSRPTSLHRGAHLGCSQDPLRLGSARRAWAAPGWAEASRKIVDRAGTRHEPAPRPAPHPCTARCPGLRGRLRAGASILVGADLGWWGDSALGTGPWLLLVDGRLRHLRRPPRGSRRWWRRRRRGRAHKAE